MLSSKDPAEMVMVLARELTANTPTTNTDMMAADLANDMGNCNDDSMLAAECRSQQKVSRFQK